MIAPRVLIACTALLCTGVFAQTPSSAMDYSLDTEQLQVKPVGYGISSKGLRSMGRTPTTVQTSGNANTNAPLDGASASAMPSRPQVSSQIAPGEPNANIPQPPSAPLTFAPGRSVDGLALVAMDPSGIYYVQNITSSPLTCQATGYKAAYGVIAPTGTIHKAFVLQSQQAERPFFALPLTKLHVVCQQAAHMRPSWLIAPPAWHW